MPSRKGSADRSWSEYKKSTNKFLTDDQIEVARRHYNKLMGYAGVSVGWDKVRCSENEEIKQEIIDNGYQIKSK